MFDEEEIERVISKQKDRWKETLRAYFNIHRPYLVATLSDLPSTFWWAKGKNPELARATKARIQS